MPNGPKCPICTHDMIRGKESFECPHCGKCLDCRRATILKCDCGFMQIAIVSGDGIKGIQCSRCRNHIATEIPVFPEAKSAVDRAEKVITLLPFCDSYSGDECTCEDYEFLPEDHDSDCPVAVWFFEHFRAAEDVVDNPV